MGRKSKAKGNANELDIARTLAEWSGQGFCRLPASGALRWGNGIWTYGDILPPQDFPVVIEAKHYAEVALEDVLGQRKLDAQESLVLDWWLNQTIADAKRCCEETCIRAEPLLIWKADFGRRRVMLREALWETLPFVSVVPTLLFRIPGLDNRPVIMDLERLLAAVPYVTLRDTINSGALPLLL
jgi:hypothetical protein